MIVITTMKELPTNCRECPFFTSMCDTCMCISDGAESCEMFDLGIGSCNEWNHGYCKAAIPYEKPINIETKPADCPLKDIQERRKPNWRNIFTKKFTS